MSISEQAAGADVASLSAPIPVAWTQTPHHVWRRLFATSYDIIALGILGTSVMSAMIGLFSPVVGIEFDRLPNESAGKFAWWFISGLIALPLMAFFLSEFGATPGKWIWGVKLERKDGGPLNFILMLKRELMMFFLGFGANLGLPTIIVGVLSRSTLEKTGETGWDATYTTRILYRENSVYRIVIGVSALLSFLLLSS